MADASRVASPESDRLRSALARRVGVDPRGLAALRVSLGLMLVADLLLRSRNLVAFYTDAGVLPRSVLFEQYPVIGRLSVHALSGAAWVQVALFVLAGAGAVALAVGYRTRLATAVSLALLVSLHARNPVVLNAGDSLLRRLLLWGLFLPLGARWSLAATGRRERVTNLATAALLCQVVLVYVVNALLKLRSDLWVGGEAVRYVFGLDGLTVLLGDVLAGHPLVLEAMGLGWLVLVCLSPLLLLTTGRARTVLVVAFAVAHLGMLVTLRLGLFPLVSVAALLPFLPPAAWDAAAARLSPVAGRLRRVTAGWRNAPVRRDVALPPSVVATGRQAVPAVVAVLLVTVLAWNAMGLGYVGTPDAVASAASPAEYRWDMFAPAPRRDGGHYVVSGRLASGGTVRGVWSVPGLDRPPDHRWYVYLTDLRRPGHEGVRPAFGSYLCRRYDATHRSDLAGVTVAFVEWRVRLDGPAPTRRVTVLEHDCRAPPG